MVDAMRYVVRKLAADDLGAYSRFVERNYGGGCYQRSADWLSWLYTENPNSAGLESDLWVALTGEMIVGCFHVLRVPLDLGGMTSRVRSFNNLFVEKEHRGGVGVWLIRRALADDSLGLLAGSNAAADNIYRTLGCPDLGCCWLWRLVAFRNILRLPAERERSNADRAEFGAAGRRRGWGEFRWSATWSPPERVVDAVLRLRERGRSSIRWDWESFRWRYFHRCGPKHALVWIERDGAACGYAVVSMFRRRGLTCGAVLELEANADTAMVALLGAIDAFLKRSGIFVGLFATTDRVLAARMLEYGWRNRIRPPGCRIYCGRKAEKPPALNIAGGAWDFGVSF